MSTALPPFAAWLAATLLPLGAAWLLFRLVLRLERCFGYNRALLLLAPLLAAGLPLLPRPALLAWFEPAASSQAGATGVTVLLPALSRSITTEVGAGEWAGWPWLAVLYGAGVALGLSRLAYRLWQLRRTARQLPRQEQPGYVLQLTGGRLPTSSFGNIIFWDDTASLSPAEAASVLAHELAHVRQGHTYDVLWLEVWRAVLWPNPFAHLLLPALRLTHELLADREAAAVGAPPTPCKPGEASYSALLARLTAHRLVGPTYLPLLQPFTFSFTLTRLAMLQNQTPVRRWKQWLALPALAGLLVVACQPERVAIEPNANVNSTKVYTFVEQMPELPGGGGLGAVMRAIQKNLVYPTVDDDAAEEGRIFVSFTVEANGAVRDAKIVKGLAPLYDNAVLKAVQRLPRFEPGRQSGRALAVSLTVPLTLKYDYAQIERHSPGALAKSAEATGPADTFVEPELPGGGGPGAMLDALQANLAYPLARNGAPVRGIVSVHFEIGVDGVVRNAKIENLSSSGYSNLGSTYSSPGPAYEEAALAAVNKFPRFIPARRDGKAVSLSIHMPVRFAK